LQIKDEVTMKQNYGLYVFMLIALTTASIIDAMDGKLASSGESRQSGLSGRSTGFSTQRTANTSQSIQQRLGSQQGLDSFTGKKQYGAGLPRNDYPSSTEGSSSLSGTHTGSYSPYGDTRSDFADTKNGGTIGNSNYTGVQQQRSFASIRGDSRTRDKDLASGNYTRSKEANFSGVNTSNYATGDYAGVRDTSYPGTSNMRNPGIMGSSYNK
jgi:hypothetical protein